MTQKELMIGDWVKVTDDWTDDSFIFFGQVKAIDELENVYVTEGEDVAYPYSIDCLEPIPLTREILEKNGFKIIQTERVGPAFGPCAELRNERFYVKVLFNGNGTISTEIGNQVSLKNENGLADMRSFTCDWVNDMCVHELQHALRLCGIDKEIVL